MRKANIYIDYTNRFQIRDIKPRPLETEAEMLPIGHSLSHLHYVSVDIALITSDTWEHWYVDRQTSTEIAPFTKPVIASYLEPVQRGPRLLAQYA